MKKIINYIGIGLTIISFPFNVLAYSNKVIMGGQNVGININSNGVMVVGFYKINGVYNGSKLMAGDYIYEVGSKSVNTINELVKAIDSEAKDNQVEIKYRRGNNTYKTRLNLEYKDNVYKTIIPRNVKLSEAPSFGMPITQYAPMSKGARCYEKLANEILKTRKK